MGDKYDRLRVGNEIIAESIPEPDIHNLFKKNKNTDAAWSRGLLEQYFTTLRIELGENLLALDGGELPQWKYAIGALEKSMQRSMQHTQVDHVAVSEMKRVIKEAADMFFYRSMPKSIKEIVHTVPMTKSMIDVVNSLHSIPFEGPGQYAQTIETIRQKIILQLSDQSYLHDDIEAGITKLKYLDIPYIVSKKLFTRVFSPDQFVRHQNTIYFTQRRYEAYYDKNTTCSGKYYVLGGHKVMVKNGQQVISGSLLVNLLEKLSLGEIHFWSLPSHNITKVNRKLIGFEPELLRSFMQIDSSKTDDETRIMHYYNVADLLKQLGIIGTHEEIAAYRDDCLQFHRTKTKTFERPYYQGSFSRYLDDVLKKIILKRNPYIAPQGYDASVEGHIPLVSPGFVYEDVPDSFLEVMKGIPRFSSFAGKLKDNDNQ